MALTKTTKKTSSIIKTRSQSRTGTTPRTGTNVRTNDDTIAPAPAPTTGRTIDADVAPAPVVTTTDPAPVEDLFAGRPTTGALKDPPAPRDSNSDDDAKKPTAKPKGRRPKATTRKPRKPHNPADDLVDPMANIHVGDAISGRVVTAGGLARAGGNDLSWPIRYSQIRNNSNRNSLMNPNPRRRHVAQWTDVAHLARIAPATVMMTMMRTPTAP